MIASVFFISLFFLKFQFLLFLFFHHWPNVNTISSYPQFCRICPIPKSTLKNLNLSNIKVGDSVQLLHLEICLILTIFFLCLWHIKTHCPQLEIISFRIKTQWYLNIFRLRQRFIRYRSESDLQLEITSIWLFFLILLK